MAGGGFVVWDVASAISRAAQLTTATKTSDLPSGRVRQDEIGTLVESFGKMLATIEHQTDEINQFPQRLDQLVRQAFARPLDRPAQTRGLFVDRIALALTRTERRGERLAVLFLDLDRFRVITRIDPGTLRLEITETVVMQDTPSTLAKLDGEVNLTEQAKLGCSYLRPLQMAFDDCRKFMLPIRLGTVNADGPQELFVYALTERAGGDDEQPHGAAADRHGAPRARQGGVCRVLSRDVRRAGEEGEDARSVPRIRVGHGLVRSVRGRAALRRRAEEARRVLALGERGRPGTQRRDLGRGQGRIEVFITRLHVRYDATSFPEDLVFQETRGPRELPGPLRAAASIQGRGRSARRPPAIAASCSERAEREAGCARLTHRLAHRGHPPQDGSGLRRGGPDGRPWWKRMWSE